MSVINDMLRRLDARGAAAPRAADAAAAPTLASAKLKARGNRWRLPVIVAAGGVVIAVTALADWPGRSAADTTPAELAAVAEQPLPAPMPAQREKAGGEGGGAQPGAVLEPATLTPSSQPSPALQQKGQDNMASAPTPALREREPSESPTTHIDKRQRPATPEQQVALLYRQAVDAAQAGQSRQALDGLNTLLAQHPRHTAARELAAALAQEVGQSAQAQQLLREGLAQGDAQASPRWALLLARLAAAQGRPEEALRLLEQHPQDSAEAAGLRAAVHAQRGEHLQALVAYEAAARTEPGNALWWLGMAVVLDAVDDKASARAAYARAQATGLAQEDLARYAAQRLQALD